MEPDTFAVIAVIALLAVAALILAFLLNARRGAALRERADHPAAGAKRKSERRGPDGKPRP